MAWFTPHPTGRGIWSGTHSQGCPFLFALLIVRVPLGYFRRLPPGGFAVVDGSEAEGNPLYRQESFKTRQPALYSGDGYAVDCCR